MAIRTFQGPFQDLVSRRKVKVSFHLLMARQAEGHLLALEQILPDLSPVDLVAVIAGDGAQLVNPSSELKKFSLFLVAGQARIRSFRSRLAFEGEDESFSFGLRMLLTRTMAGFTLLFPVGIFLEGIVGVRVTPVAGLRPDESFLFPFCLFLTERGKTDEEQEACYGNGWKDGGLQLVHSHAPFP